MSEKFISSEALNSFFDKQIQLYENCPDKYDAAVELKGTSHLIPAADVRPVVLCKDCLHEDCAMYHGPNWFCADGAKREES